MITEDEFRRLCDDVYRDRHQIFEFNPAATPAEALLWMLLASLYSLLSLDPGQIPAVANATADWYVNTICLVLDDRRVDDFEVRKYLLDLVSRVDRDD